MSTALQTPTPLVIDAGTVTALIEALRRKAEKDPEAGWSIDGDMEWSEGVEAPRDALAFAQETIFVICNSGMKNTVARRIYERVMSALFNGLPAASAFGHVGKAAAMQHVWDERDRLHAEYMAADDKLAFCAALPWIGGITKYHLAKNFGADVMKPDVHLVRLAQHAGEDPHALCARLARETGYRVGTVDLILWRACAVGVIDSPTGAMHLEG